MSLHPHRQRYHNIAAETTGDEMHMSQHYTNPRKRKVDITGQTAAVPHCCTVWETRIHQFEKDAYTSVLRAFKSQADSISWERESLITNLRKELRLSNDEHGEILCKINTENCFQGIRTAGCWESCRACGDQYGVISAANVSYNKGSYGNANGTQHKQSKKHSHVSHQPSGVLSALNQQYSLTKGRKPLKVKNIRNVDKEFANPVQHPSLAPNEMGKTSFNVSSNPFITKTDELANHNYLLGQKGLHALSFNFASGNDNLQWIDLTKSPTGDNQLENEDPEMTTLSHCFKPSVENTSFAPEIYRESAGRGTCTRKRKPESDFLKVPGCSGSGQDTSEIKIRMTNDLLQTVMSNHNVKRVFNGGNVNPYTVRDAKEVLKEHEKTLIRVLESLADVSDDE